MILRLCLLLVFALAFARGAIEEHRILTLPGYGKPKTKMYSGYIDTPHPTNISTTVHSHYWFVTCSECMDSASAPTLIWMQGGPGGSSLIGLFTENGPLTLNDFSVETDAFNQSGVPTVFDNPYSWHALANVVYFEHPAPTGFSYCSGYGNDSFSCPPWDDTLQAESSYAFFVAFFEHYPELKENPFLLSGESYAGVLVPTLVQNLLARRTKDNVKTAPWSVSGFALGNDCPGNRVYTCTPYSGWIGTQVALDFRFRHGMISEDLYAEINDACAGEWGTFEAPRSETCRTLLEDPIHPVMSEAGNTYEMGNGYGRRASRKCPFSFIGLLSFTRSLSVHTHSLTVLSFYRCISSSHTYAHTHSVIICTIRAIPISSRSTPRRIVRGILPRRNTQSRISSHDGTSALESVFSKAHIRPPATIDGTEIAARTRAGKSARRPCG